MTAEPSRGAADRIRRLRSLIESPADLWLLFRMVPWAAVLPVLKHVVRLDTLARLMWTDPKDVGTPDTERIVALSAILARPVVPSRGKCYERSLLAYRFLAQRGADPRLVVAVKSSEGGVMAHAWVTVNGMAIRESEETVEFVPVVVYGPGGRGEPAGAGRERSTASK
jgi:hypothetical protein